MIRGELGPGETAPFQVDLGSCSGATFFMLRPTGSNREGGKTTTAVTLAYKRRPEEMQRKSLHMLQDCTHEAGRDSNPAEAYVDYRNAAKRRGLDSAL